MRARWLALVALPLLLGADWFPIKLIADPAARSVDLPARPAACYAMTATGTCGVEPPTESGMSNAVCREAGAVTLNWQAPTTCVDNSPLAAVTLWTVYTDTLPPQPRPAAPTLVRLAGLPTSEAPSMAAYELSGASYDTKSLDVSGKETTPRFWLDAGGTRLYVTGSSSDAVHQYTLSTAWDITTASFIATYTMGGGSNGRNPTGLHFHPDGTSFFITTSFNDRVVKYALGTAWDITTASESQLFSVASQTAIPQGVAISDDGFTMFVLGGDNDTLFQYTMGTAFSLATASYDTVSFSVGSQEATPQGIAIAEDGARLYMVGNTNDTVYRYTLSTPWDLSTISYASDSFSIASQTGAPLAVRVSEDGLKMYASSDDLSPDRIFQYTLAVAGGSYAFDSRERQLAQLVLH